MEKVKIVDYPPIYLYDTPGILPPTIYNVEVGMLLALFDYVKPTVEVEIIADYLLFMLNKRGIFNYVTRYALDAVTDDISELLNKICESNNMGLRTTSGKVTSATTPDWHGASQMFLSDFRRGDLGKFSFDLASDATWSQINNIDDTLGQTESMMEKCETEGLLDDEVTQKVTPRLIGDVSQLINVR